MVVTFTIAGSGCSLTSFRSPWIGCLVALFTLLLGSYRVIVGLVTSPVPPSDPTELVRVSQAVSNYPSPWEEACLQFETPEQQIENFMRRLLWAGCEEWDKHATIVELSCGRSKGLHALTRLFKC